ncbi:NmrA-like family protein [Colletotrichum truncatum]|uniref:NmrA-like family protein n=1 Tax=Colletotrichum truncatum TaxID=5467 RepID=A0ACC3YYM1_COLTU|nr:NmrA-like family protein [Colletotrichum truncatum]KAF6791263.1 NmrA-like family protein [Colletotrichum truncatum]
MAPAILIVGATGNTGRGVTEALPELLKASKALSDHRVLALTRSADSSTAQNLAKIPGVTVIEQNWTEITADWLREHQVVRAFIAPHLAPNQFAEESAFHVAALNAGVEYVVRISTTAAAVRPDFGSYYPRAHWAIEAMLGSAEFGALKWTSLQPNAFLDGYLAPAAQYIKRYKETGELGTLSLMAAKDAPVAPNDPVEVGVFAARLLALDDPSPHSGAKYVLNGPEDITGEQIVKLVEKHIGTEVKDVVYQDLSFIEAFVASGFGGPGQSKTVLRSMRYGLMTMWKGVCVTATTSKEVKEIGGPKRTPAEMLNRLLEG